MCYLDLLDSCSVTLTRQLGPWSVSTVDTRYIWQNATLHHVCPVYLVCHLCVLYVFKVSCIHVLVALPFNCTISNKTYCCLTFIKHAVKTFVHMCNLRLKERLALPHDKLQTTTDSLKCVFYMVYASIVSKWSLKLACIVDGLVSME